MSCLVGLAVALGGGRSPLAVIVVPLLGVPRGPRAWIVAPGAGLAARRTLRRVRPPVGARARIIPSCPADAVVRSVCISPGSVIAGRGIISGNKWRRPRRWDNRDGRSGPQPDKRTEDNSNPFPRPAQPLRPPWQRRYWSRSEGQYLRSSRTAVHLSTLP